MKIQIVSDLHLEFSENKEYLKQNPLKYNGDILLLAGDIITDKHRKKGKEFYNVINDNFQTIISIMGNHEFYYGEIDYAYPSYKSKIDANHYKINNDILVIDNIKVICSTLWSYIPDENKNYLYQVMNDYRLIYKKNFNDKVNILIDETNNYHKQSVDFIINELEKPFNGKIIILTHHLPSFNCIDSRYDNYEILKYAFATNLENIIAKYNIDYWIFGHIHESINQELYGTKLISNPLGYISENQKYSFKNDLVLNI